MEFELLIPLAAVLLIFGMPIIAILTKHQQKMAEFMHGRNAENNQVPALYHEVQMLRAEVTKLREQLNEQTLLVDDLRRGITFAETPVAERLNQDA